MIDYSQFRAKYANDPDVLALVERIEGLEANLAEATEMNTTMLQAMKKSREAGERDIATMKAIQAQVAGQSDVGGVCPSCGQARPFNPRLN
jgi:hypothetical protein